MRYFCLSLAALFLLTACLDRPAAAVLQFYKVYQSVYLDNHPDQEFAELAKKPANRCFACHQGKKRKNHNPFGEELKKLLDKKKDAKDIPKITAALEKVTAMPSDPNDPNSETYGERIAAGKWPAGVLDDLKLEPAGEAPSDETSDPAAP